MQDEAQTKVCTKCGEEKGLDGFARSSREADKKCQKCRACVEAEKEEARAKRSDAIAFVSSICRTPRSCLSKSKTKPCHGCSLSHKARTDEAYVSKLREIGAIGLDRVANDEALSSARAERMSRLFEDKDFLAAHVDRNRGKLKAIYSNPDALERKRVGTVNHNKSEKMINLSRERFIDPDYQAARLAGLKAYYALRRENEEFQSFMERMEAEAAEWEATNHTTTEEET